MMEHMTAHLSDLLCGFRQGYNTQHALTRFLEKCETYLDTGGKAGLSSWIFLRNSIASTTISYRLTACFRFQP